MMIVPTTKRGTLTSLNNPGKTSIHQNRVHSTRFALLNKMPPKPLAVPRKCPTGQFLGEARKGTDSELGTEDRHIARHDLVTAPSGSVENSGLFVQEGNVIGDSVLVPVWDSSQQVCPVTVKSDLLLVIGDSASFHKVLSGDDEQINHYQFAILAIRDTQQPTGCVVGHNIFVIVEIGGIKLRIGLGILDWHLLGSACRSGFPRCGLFPT